MSTIVAANVSDGTVSIPTTYVTNGSAKAWVNFNGEGTIAIRQSLNASSLTDNGTGNYNVTLSSALQSDEYSIVSGSTDNLTNGSDMCTAAPLTSSSCRVIGFYTDNAGARDILYSCAAIHGDLA